MLGENLHSNLYCRVSNLSEVSTVYDYVVIKPSRRHEQISSESELVVSTQEDNDTDQLQMGQHICTSGEVVCVPSFVRNGFEVECSVGDTVWYHFNSDNRVSHPHDARAFIFDGEEYIFINYYFLFCGKKLDGTKYCMNDYSLIEPCKTYFNKNGIFVGEGLNIPMDYLDNVDTIFPIGYLRYTNVEGLELDDLYLLKSYSNMELETSMHTTFEGRNIFWVASKDKFLCSLKSRDETQ